MRRRLRERRYSKRTEEAYVHWMRRFIRFHGRRHPKDLAEPEVTAFLSALAVEEAVAQSTQKQALSALVFLYDRVLARPLRELDRLAPARSTIVVPTVLSEREIRAVLGHLAAVPRLCAEVMYGRGLRITQCVALRVKDIDFDRLTIVVRSGKGGKDPDAAGRTVRGGAACASRTRPQAIRRRHAS